MPTACQQYFLFVTKCYSNGSDSPHRHDVTPLPRAIGFVKMARKMDTFIAKGVWVYVPLKCSFSSVIPAPNLMHGSFLWRTSVHIPTGSIAVQPFL